MEQQTYYQVLGVPISSSHEQIEAAYRALAVLYHPDKCGGNATTFKVISEAHKVLRDPLQRAKYDAQYGYNFVERVCEIEKKIASSVGPTPLPSADHGRSQESRNAASAGDDDEEYVP